MYFSQGLEVVQTKRHKETRQSISHKLWLKHFYSLKAIDIFCLFSQFIVKTLRPAFIPKDYMQNEIDNYLILIPLQAPVFE